METDWELKERRMAWENIETACSRILAARMINGSYTEKDTKKIMKELRDMRTIEFEAFLNIPSGEPGKKNIISPHHPEDTTAVSSVSSSPGSPPPPRQGCFYCTDCNLEITVAEKDFSERRYFKPLCRECQKHYKV